MNLPDFLQETTDPNLSSRTLRFPRNLDLNHPTHHHLALDPPHQLTLLRVRQTRNVTHLPRLRLAYHRLQLVELQPGEVRNRLAEEDPEDTMLLHQMLVWD